MAKNMSDTHRITDSPRLLNIKKASLYSGIPIWGIRNLIWNEQLPHITIGKKFYIDVNDIEVWINNNKVCPGNLHE